MEIKGPRAVTLTSQSGEFAFVRNRYVCRVCRHGNEYARVPETSEAFNYIAMINLMSRRLPRQEAL